MLLFTMQIIMATFLSATPSTDLAEVQILFQNPPAEYTSGPLWVWNDLLTAEQLEHALDVLAAQHIRQVWVHPRPGLMTPYLSEEWFTLWKATLEAGKKRGMLVWIYDENSYPSGFAGGNVPVQMPESRGMGITLRPEDKVKLPHKNIVAVYRKTAEGYANVTEELSQANKVVEGDFLVARIEESAPSPWFGGKTYVDLLHPGVTEKFLELTLEPYRNHFGNDFGTSLPGSFTDEPHLKPCGDIHWTPDLPEQFKQRWNEDFFDGLPHLRDDSEQGRRFRHRYLYTLNDLFIKRWAKPYYEYCETHNLEFTGHYWEHEWPNCASVPDNMAMSAWQQRPGIDTLFNQYDEGPHSQFGNVRAVIEVASVARQMGHSRTLCEAYGGSSAEMRFEDYKRIGDWLQVLGVNTINEHLSDVTIRGARKRDYPPTFSYHSPWMESYHTLVDYFSRISAVLSQGKQINRCLVLEPTTTAWMHHFTDTGRLAEIGNGFQALVTMLAKEQIAFDLGSEAVIEEFGGQCDIEGQPALKVGECAYTAVVIPAEMENINRPVFNLIQEYLKRGGVVFSCASPGLPGCIDGQPAEECATLQTHEAWTSVQAEELPERIQERCKPRVRVTLDQESKGTVYHHHRQMDNGDVLFIVNISNNASASGVISAVADGIRDADLESGIFREYPFEKNSDGQVGASFTLPPCGSIMLFLDMKYIPAEPPMQETGDRIVLPISGLQARRLDDNNLILDYMDISAGKESATGVFWKKAADISFKQNGLRGNIWDHCVQFQDELLKTEFPADSGFEAQYRFYIEEAVPQQLYAVVERADLYTITCNGIPVIGNKEAFWLDRAFGKLDISKAAHLGENILKIQAAPMTIFHELEAAHIVGDFSLKSADKGFVITPSQTVGLGFWKEQGLPLYGHRVAYAADLNLDNTSGRYCVSLPDWRGVVAKVIVNGKESGHIFRQPFECDITEYVNPGQNKIEVVIYGSLRNTLGPHHGEGSTGLTHPGSWNNAPESGPPAGKDYYAMEYGLTEPFQVWKY